MSCDAVAAAFLFFAAAGPAPAPADAAPAAVSIAAEPLFVDIVTRAGKLRSQVDAYSASPRDGGTAALPGYAAFKAQVGELAALVMQGHENLKSRGLDGDLKCILRGIAQDLPVKLAELEKANDAKAQGRALSQLRYLLNDNVEVVTAPPQPAAEVFLKPSAS